ncbi:MAG: outer membrane lipoprotein carrier protein LolA [Leptospiraceae bacterium]|nr:outer membrane lipoprotein carrier protein LolA [Leptospiraceae bacterium]MCP5513050.1 outer membrane lipoprotein carrier protein LolA [Leptospiraceae bacterium]
MKKKIPIIFIGFLFSFPLYSQSGEELLSVLLSTMNSFESIRANITINGTSGLMSYKKPHNLYLKLSDGRILSANGKHLWFYNPSSAIAGKQDLKGGSGGLYGLLSGYENVSATGTTIRLTSEKKAYEEIIVSMTPNNILRSIRMKPRGRDSYTEISLSGVQTNIGLPASIFNYHPPSSAQIVENPLNQRE